MELEFEKTHFDLGHRGDVDYTLIVRMLALSPTQRLDLHEGWRQFMKEAQARAGIHQGNHRSPGTSTG